MRTIASPQALLSIALLSGCAVAHSSAAERPEPDCSFRSASTCWTLSGRFPLRRHDQAPPKPDDTRSRSPVVLATEADSTRTSR